MPFPVQIRRLAQQLVRRLGLQGHLGLVLLEDVQPVLDIFGAGVESVFLRDEHRFAGAVSVTAAAGRVPFVQLSLQASAAGTLAVVEQMVLSTVNAQDARLTLVAAAAVVGQHVPLDTRDHRSAGLNDVCRAVVSAADDAAPPTMANSAQHRVLLATGDKEVNLPLVIHPGFAYRWTGTGVATTLQVSWAWREFTAAPQEPRA